jgi:hypothetical protein
MKRIYVPTSSLEDWRMGLAAPDRQWKQGYSAYELAHCWENAKGFPREVETLFTQSPFLRFAEIELLIALPECEVAIPGGKRGSHSDLFVLAKGADGQLVSIAVEGKVSESFGPMLSGWNREGSPGKEKRLTYLQSILNLPHSLPDTLRYQLLHRTASALIMAHRFKAPIAAMIVHSFSPEKEGFADYCDFAALYGIDAGSGELVRLTKSEDVDLYVGWATGVNSLDGA